MTGRGGMFGDTPIVDPQALIAADFEIVRRDHERGVKVFGATIKPFEGADYYSRGKRENPGNCQRMDTNVESV
jgi:hypothetical protein